ncbi:MAG TPA: nucleotidyltransferase family protein [Spongiibacteraceae bacterium]
MKAMILAAGLGTRMRPLTEHTPKALLKVAGRPLIEHHILRLVRAGITELVINHAHLGEQIEAYLGDGTRFDCAIAYSREGEPLETGGGILRALSLLDEQAFIVVNADIWTDYPFENLLNKNPQRAHLVMTDNPPQHPLGDFYLQENGLLRAEGDGNKLTWTGLRILHPSLFNGCNEGIFSIVPLLKQAMAAGLVTGEYYRGQWFDIGTPERLRQVNALLPVQTK